MSAIYQPKGKAGEYAKYAVNFYVGCSNDCDYCYCKRGLLGHAMGAPIPTLKKCFDGHSPYGVFIRELHERIEPLRRHGLFFSFTTDPLLPETQDLTNAAVLYAVNQGVPCKILTKRADFKVLDSFEPFKHLIAYGFTLTGMDELERNASTNTERIERMADLHRKGFKTFASIEPIINLDESGEMIRRTLGFCDLYKIGLLTGHKQYTPEDVAHFVVNINDMVLNHNFDHCEDVKVYWKDSVLEFLKMDKEYRYNVSPFSWRFDMSCHVDANYDMFH
jgi:DNA repair photolyase